MWCWGTSHRIVCVIEAPSLSLVFEVCPPFIDKFHFIIVNGKAYRYKREVNLLLSVADAVQHSWFTFVFKATLLQTRNDATAINRIPEKQISLLPNYSLVYHHQIIQQLFRQ